MKTKEATLMLVGTYVLAVVINFEGFFWGDATVDGAQIIATAGYAAVSIYYLLYTRKHRGCVLFSACGGGGLLLAGGFALLARSCCEIVAVPAALFAAVFITPLYGAGVIFRDWDVLYAAMAVTGGAWLCVSLLLFRGNEKEHVKREKVS